MPRTSLSLDVVLLVVLSGAVIADAHDGIPWMIRPVALALVAAYVVLHLWAAAEPTRQRLRDRGKWTLLAALVALLAVFPTLYLAYERHHLGELSIVHDGVLQVEAAITFLLSGRDPYSVTYFATQLAQWPYVGGTNPALYNLVYPPLSIILGVPFHLAAHATLGWYDQRFLYLAAYLGMLVAFGSLARERVRRMSVVVVLGLSPMLLPFVIYGYNDVLTLALMGASLAALRIRGGWALPACAVMAALAVGSKQQAAFLVPYLAIHTWPMAAGQDPRGRGLAWLRKFALPFTLTSGVIFLPFLAWDAPRFVEGTVLFLSGQVQHNYPIKTFDGLGFADLLMSGTLHRVLAGVTSGPLHGLRGAADAMWIRAPGQPFPFGVFQLLFGLPVLALTLRRQWRDNRLPVMLAGYGALLLVLGYFSRYFHDSHLGVVACVVALAFLLEESPSRVSG
ncbi:MAG: hypothetical protein ACYDAY_03805 [Candidatus Dormibacteria bacterium]